MNKEPENLTYEEQEIDTSTAIGEQAMHVTVIPPEDPQAVRERDGIKPPYVGRKPMTKTSFPAVGDRRGSEHYAHGRKAPKHTGEWPD